MTSTRRTVKAFGAFMPLRNQARAVELRGQKGRRDFEGDPSGIIRPTSLRLAPADQVSRGFQGVLFHRRRVIADSDTSGPFNGHEGLLIGSNVKSPLLRAAYGARIGRGRSSEAAPVDRWAVQMQSHGRHRPAIVSQRVQLRIEIEGRARAGAVRAYIGSPSHGTMGV